VFGLVADDVDYVVDGDAAEQDVAVVDHRRADPVVVGELARDLVPGFDHVDRRLLVVDQLVDRRVGLMRQQHLQRDAAQVLVASADDVKMIGVFRQLAAQAQVAQHNVHRGVGAHRHHVRVHQAAGGVFLVGQHLFEALAVLAVHRLEHFVDDRVRQVLDQVGEVVDVEVLDRGDDLVRIHVREQALAHLVANVDQDLAVVLGIDQSPHHLALGRRQRFEQVADLGGREGIDQPPHGPEATAVERVGKQTQLARGLVVADGFCHAVTSEAASRRVCATGIRRSCAHYRPRGPALPTRRSCLPWERLQPRALPRRSGDQSKARGSSRSHNS